MWTLFSWAKAPTNCKSLQCPGQICSLQWHGTSNAQYYRQRTKILGSFIRPHSNWLSQHNILYCGKRTGTWICKYANTRCTCIYLKYLQTYKLLQLHVRARETCSLLLRKVNYKVIHIFRRLTVSMLAISSEMEITCNPDFTTKLVCRAVMDYSMLKWHIYVSCHLKDTIPKNFWGVSLFRASPFN